MIKIERIIPYLMDGLAALAGGVVSISGLLLATLVVFGEMPPKGVAALLLYSATLGAFLAVRIARKSIHDQVHMELAEGGK